MPEADISELVAGKAALRNAGAELGNYLSVTFSPNTEENKKNAVKSGVQGSLAQKVPDPTSLLWQKKMEE